MSKGFNTYLFLFSLKGHSGPGGLALAYLNEYSIVSAAFTLHSSELKVIKVVKAHRLKLF